jgi:hypothetical protein
MVVDRICVVLGLKNNQFEWWGGGLCETKKQPSFRMAGEVIMQCPFQSRLSVLPLVGIRIKRPLRFQHKN